MSLAARLKIGRINACFPKWIINQKDKGFRIIASHLSINYIAISKQ